jgi:hypothetical protein
LKRGIAEHPKTKRLARLLAIPMPYAVGLVEMLCNQWAPKAALCGDIGKWEDVDIAEGIGWPGDPTALIAGFVAAGQVDRCATHRLVIHDWHEHCDESVKKTLKKKGLAFANNGSVPERSGTVLDSSGTILDESSTVPSVNAERLAKAKALALAKASSSETAENQQRTTSNELSAADETTARPHVASAVPLKPDSLEYWRDRAHREFPALVQQNFRGAVASCVWKDVCGGPPPVRKLEPLDGVNHVPVDRLAMGLRRYLLAKRKVAGGLYGIEDFVSKITDWVPPPEAKPRRVIRSDADLTPEERAAAAALTRGRDARAPRDRREAEAPAADAVHRADAERHGEPRARPRGPTAGAGDAAPARRPDGPAPSARLTRREAPILGVARSPHDSGADHHATERGTRERVAATAAAPVPDRGSGDAASGTATVGSVGSLVAGMIAHTRMPV